MSKVFLLLLAVTGIVLFTVGILVRVYPINSRVFNKKTKVSVKSIANSKAFLHLTDLITSKGTNGIYRFCNKLLKMSEAEINVQTLLFYKLLTITVASVLLLMIRYTNLDVIKISIISNASNHVNLFGTSTSVDYQYNFSLYKTVIGRIGEKKLEGLDEDKKLDAVKTVLSEQMKGNVGAIEERAKTILRTFNKIEDLHVIDWKTVVLILIAFFIPDLLLLLRRALLNNKYKKEVVKLENIFELLGSIKGFKTIYILKEMSKASKTCSKQLKRCLTDFQGDREHALEKLRKSVPNRKFSRLVDIIRVYSLVDKEIAMEILERNRLEKEEEMLLTAEEDVDIVDVIAFISVTPIVFELGNLMMKPMMDIISQAFSVI